ncbi:MAG: CPBP family intramembrane glutamic endopeptidase [Candidatus Omnitrophota bacterium]
MKISAKEWVLFISIALIGFFTWLKLGYPQLSFVYLSVDKPEACRKAQEYLVSRGVAFQEYRQAAVFRVENWQDRYLQKTLGAARQEVFMKENKYELFSWRIRFFKEFQKEEYLIEISPQSGQVLRFTHLIEDTAVRPAITQDAARLAAKEFFIRNYDRDFREYEPHAEQVKRYDHRTDYFFSWEKKGVYIPWKKDKGGAKLLLAANVCGNEVSQFSVNDFEIPDQFYRDISKELLLGEYLYSVYYIILIGLIVAAIYVVVKKRQSVVVLRTRVWYLTLAVFVCGITIADLVNNIQSVIAYYPTSGSLGSFLGIYFFKAVINLVLLSVMFIMPGVAGETLCAEVLPDKPLAGFTHYLRSSFLTRGVCRGILFGYVLCVILIGMQAGLFYLGQRYFGVWKEWFRLSQYSSSYFPVFSAFTVGFIASLNEEVVYRLFGISWGKKYLRNTLLAVIAASFLWGFGHSEYAIFPTWFRGIEVGTMGLVYGFVFLRYGIIPLIVAHYLFDVF